MDDSVKISVALWGSGLKFCCQSLTSLTLKPEILLWCDLIPDLWDNKNDKDHL
ncbi:hypothetical protein PCC9214_02754 [Planktothrix tepida]|uniref:Uncharacterized protein n=2 Tax=Planktothrix TaxID=54304 RepID=A0A1J1LPA8_9CYAN|nr:MULTISPECIES: hypothetical protein [Planktothrix]CAD5954236.1 hypothetical protein PCC9214_02754 [Planktothrix tepida]CAD5956419.1 hypothetical protein NO713_02909 [Planktothrix pseudagardhii]CUR34247.1 hypothetical protein PL9214640254 [Planktothrix tepida PCC 9214]